MSSLSYPPSPSLHLNFTVRCRLASCVADTPSIGSGAVYSFDPVGSYEREACRAAGAAQSLVQPFLDNQVSQIYLRHPVIYPTQDGALVIETTLGGRVAEPNH